MTNILLVILPPRSLANKRGCIASPAFVCFCVHMRLRHLSRFPFRRSRLWEGSPFSFSFLHENVSFFNHLVIFFMVCIRLKVLLNLRFCGSGRKGSDLTTAFPSVCCLFMCLCVCVCVYECIYRCVCVCVCTCVCVYWCVIACAPFTTLYCTSKRTFACDGSPSAAAACDA